MRGRCGDSPLQAVLQQHPIHDSRRETCGHSKVGGQSLEKLPFARIDLPVGEQEIGDNGKRRRSQPGGNRPGGALDDGLRILLFELPFHPVDQATNRLSRLAAKPARRPDQVMSTRQFLASDMMVGVHGADEERYQRLVDVQISARFPMHDSSLVRHILTVYACANTSRSSFGS